MVVEKETEKLVKRIADYLIEEGTTYGTDTPYISLYKIAKVFRIQESLLFDITDDIREELKNRKEVSWVSYDSCFEFSLYKRTIKNIVFYNTKGEEEKAIKFAQYKLEKKRDVLLEEHPEMKFSAGILQDCIEELDKIYEEILDGREPEWEPENDLFLKKRS